MDLLTFMKSLPREGREAFAEDCGTSVGHLLNIAYGYKHASAHLAINIEDASNGMVRAESVAPNERWAVIREGPSTCGCHGTAQNSAI